MEGALCLGCLRSLDEIARWGKAGVAEQQSILAAVALRRHQAVSSGGNAE